MAKKTNLPKRRRLSALFEKGKEVRFAPDGDDVEVIVGGGKDGRIRYPDDYEDESLKGEPIPAGPNDVTFWVQPPNPLQREEAFREAQAARARYLISAKKEEGSVANVQSEAFVAEMEYETLLDYVVMQGEAERQQQAARDVLADEEWKDVDAIQDALRQYEEKGEPEGTEWEALLERDKEYGDQVKERARQLRESARESLNLMGREELEKRAIKRRMDAHANQVFMDEFEASMLYFAIRDDEDHTELFFEDKEELLAQDPRVQESLGEVLATFISEEREAKNSPRAASSSDSSTPPSEPEISEASTPEAVNA